MQNSNNIKIKYQKIESVIDIISAIVIILFLVTYAIYDIPQLLPYNLLYPMQITFSILFIGEYTIRIIIAKHKKQYLFSIWGIIDLISLLIIILPIFSNVRIVRLFKLIRLLDYFNTKNNYILGTLFKAFHNIRGLLVVYALFYVVVVYISSVLIYSIEHDAQPEVFSSLFVTIWWCVVSLTTVGYGDIYPITTIGRLLTSILLFLGIGIIAIPTSLISASLTATILSKNHAKADKDNFFKANN